MIADPIAVIDVAGIHGESRLRARAAAVAGAVARCGAAAVAIRGSHGFETQAAILGALAAAPRILFLDPAIDPAPLEPLLRALGVEVVLDATDAPLARGAIEVLDVRALDDGSPLPADVAIACTEYAILTTGTTGEPKCILQTIAALRAHIANYAAYLDVHPGHRGLQLASAGWDAGLMDLFVCLWHGGVLYSINPRRHDVAAVRGFIAEHAIDVLHMTVPYFRLVHADPAPPYPAPVRLVLGGELITRRDLERFGRIAPAGSVVFNAYGPTECTTALYSRHAGGDAVDSETWPLAFPVADVAVELARDGERIREVGRTGEVVVRSRWLARRFDPVTGSALELDTAVVDGERYYPTGDLAHRDEQARVVITGRKDTVIKVSGQKVSLHEIETVLRSLPEVADTCVLARTGDVDATVIAAVVPDAPSVSAAALRRALAARLAPHKLPKQLLLVDALPLNQNNKIDRARILELAAAAREPGAEDGPLLEEVAKALRVGSVDASLSFAENGGDSLRALGVVAALKRRGYRVALEALVSRTPLGELRLDAPVAARTATRVASLPNRAFLEARGIPDLERWSQTVIFTHAGATDARATATLVGAVLARHAASWPGGAPTVEIVARQELRDAAAAVARRVSLAEGRACAAAVVPGDGAIHAVVSVHQFHVDRASWIVLLGELADGSAGGAAAVQAWPPPDPSSGAWAGLYQARRATDRDPLWDELPWDRCHDLAAVDAPFPAREAFRRVVLELPHDGRVAPLEEVDRQLLTAVVLGLSEARGDRWQKLDVLAHGRDLTIDGVDAHGVVGWFTVIHPFVLHVPEDAAASARAVRELVARIRPVAHTFGNAHHGRRDRRCDVSYNFLGELAIASSGAWSVDPRSAETMHGAASHRLELTGYVVEGRPHLVVEHDPSVLDDAAIARLGSAVVAAFAAVRGG